MAMLGMWKAVLANNSWQVQTIAGVVIANLGSGLEAESDARMIAASPYMLEALKAMVQLIGDNDLPDNAELSGPAVCDMARIAVTLATSR